MLANGIEGRQMVGSLDGGVVRGVVQNELKLFWS